MERLQFRELNGLTLSLFLYRDPIIPSPFIKFIPIAVLIVLFIVHVC